MKKPILLTVMLALAAPAYPAPRELKEKDYQARWCAEARGKAEYVLDDRTRVDCLTEEFAVELDFAKKWHEAVGQSLYYAAITDKKPAIVLIMEKDSDLKYYERLRIVAEKNGIMTRRMWPEDLKDTKKERTE